MPVIMAQEVAADPNGLPLLYPLSYGGERLAL